jgi:hypothetical protein
MMQQPPQIEMGLHLYSISHWGAFPAYYYYEGWIPLDLRHDVLLHHFNWDDEDWDDEKWA